MAKNSPNDFLTDLYNDAMGSPVKVEEQQEK